MRKEVGFAVVFGALAGALIAFGIWRANQAFSEEGPNEQKAASLEDSTSQTKVDGLEIASPLNDSVSTSEEVRVAGITTPGNTILIFSDDASEVTKSIGGGEFELNIELSGGINNIKVVSLAPDLSTAESSLRAIYTSDLNSTDSEDQSDEIAERVEAAANPFQAIYGTITDLTDNTIQLTDEDSQISQISLTESTSYANVVKTSEEIERDELAIGDHLIVIAKENDGVLTAARVLVSLPPEDLKTTLAIGTVQVLNSKEFTIKNSVSNDEWSLDAKGSVRITQFSEDSELKTARFANIEEGATIAVFGTVDEKTGELSASHIHIL